ncbi:hypothetical protein BH10ACT1_BH10ACT1_20850 [soil metagenome]
MTHLERLGAWPARILWLALALASTGSLSDALDGRSAAVALVARIGLALGWGAGLVALLVPRSSALTAMRVLVPGGLAAALGALAAGSVADGSDVATVALAALGTAWVLTPWMGDAWVDGSSYGSERRLLLRPPALFSYLLVPVTWVLVVAGATVGPLLLAARQWVPGAVLLVLGWAAAAAGGRSLHQLSRRWVVLVPSGMVIHDPLTMPEAQLFLRRMISRLGPAPAGTTAHDLTAGAPGLALELDLNEPADLLLRTRGRDTATRSTSSVVFTPSRPRHLLDAAAAARIPVA